MKRAPPPKNPKAMSKVMPLRKSNRNRNKGGKPTYLNDDAIAKMKETANAGLEPFQAIGIRKSKESMLAS